MNNKEENNFINYLLIAYPKHNLICYDIATLTSYDSFKKLRILFNLIHNFIGIIIENTMKNKYNLQLPQHINKIICIYITEIQNENDIIDINGYNVYNKDIQSKYDENYFCNILSYKICSYF